jgi:SOS response regulatory protein OraA/RecX
MAVELRASAVEEGIWEGVEEGAVRAEFELPFLRLRQPKRFRDWAALERYLVHLEQREIERAALRFVARRALTAHELKKALAMRRFSDGAVERAVSICLERGWINDAERQERMVEKEALKGRGARYMMAKLRAAGFSDVQISVELERKALQKAVSLCKKQGKERIAWLVRRGFSIDFLNREGVR